MEGSQQHLAREARQRPRMAVASALAGVLMFAGSLYVQNNLDDPPRAWLVESLQRVEEGGPLGPQTSLLLPFFEYVDDNIATLIISALLSGAGLILLGAVMYFLARATQARTDTLPRIAPRLPLIGATAFAAGLIVSAVGTGEHYEKLQAARTVDEVQNAEAAGLLITGQSINLVGAVALGAGTALVCLHAMRAGLLTRFLGVLGILVGVIIGFSPFLGSGFSPVQMVWLLALALLLAGRWPGGDPRAWPSGQAVPWPTAAELREAREAAAEPQPKRTAEGGASGPSPATSARKKRKRRG